MQRRKRVKPLNISLRVVDTGCAEYEAGMLSIRQVTPRSIVFFEELTGPEFVKKFLSFN
jgi:hypothetical protein